MRSVVTYLHRTLKTSLRLGHIDGGLQERKSALGPCTSNTFIFLQTYHYHRTRSKPGIPRSPRMDRALHPGGRICPGLAQANTSSPDTLPPGHGLHLHAAIRASVEGVDVLTSCIFIVVCTLPVPNAAIRALLVGVMVFVRVLNN